MAKNRVIRIGYVQDNNEKFVVITRRNGDERRYSLNKKREARMVRLTERLWGTGRAVLTQISVRATWEIWRGRRPRT